MTTVSTGYEPRYAFVPFHRRKQRWASLVCHRRAGKTVACVADLVDAALRCTKPDPRFAYVAPYYTQAKDVAWLYVKRMVRDIPNAQINESELRVDFAHNGGRVRLYGADNYDRLRGLYLDGIVLDEYADMDPRAWPEVIRPALSDRKGWATFIGTPKGRNAFWDLHTKAETDPAWFDLILRAEESGLVDDDELEDARGSMTPEQFAQEYGCSFEAAIVGAYFGKEVAQAERDGRITHVPHEPLLPVYTAWDLGISDSMAIWMFQVTHDGIRVIDYYANHGQAIPHYVAELNTRPYRWADDFVPHDAKVRSLETGRTRVETLINLGRKPRLVPDHKVMDGINAARLTIPKCRFDAEKTKDGLEALRQYRADYDEKQKVFKTTPLHNWASDPADAYRYLAMAYRELKPLPDTTPKPILGITAMTLDQAMARQPQRSRRI